MSGKHFFCNIRSRINSQQGVTLMELILVIALLTLIFGAVVSLLTSLYGSYAQTSRTTGNGREAAMIIEQLAQDIRKSVGETDDQAVTVDTEVIQITTEKQIDLIETVEYRNQAGKIVYVAGATQIELSSSGRVDVVEPTEAGQPYKITVVVGSGEGQVELTTEVARYDWGER